MSLSVRLQGFVFAACAAVISGCRGDAHSRTSSARIVDIDSVVQWTSSMKLEENDSVVTVSPRVTGDGRGGFFVVEMKERQVRHYDARGALLGVIGETQPSGRGFLTPPTGAVRLADGRVSVTELGGQVTVVDTSAGAPATSYASGLAVLYGAVTLPATGQLILVGRDPTPGSSLLHVWDPVAHRVVGRFFRLPLKARMNPTALFAGHAAAVARADTTVAAFAFEPALHVIDRRGRERVVPVPADGFRRIREAAPTNFGDRAAVDRWANSFSRVSDIAWLGGDTVIVQYYDLDGLRLRFGLVGMTLRGVKLFEVHSSPRLLGADPATSRLIFVDPRFKTPDAWRFASLRAPRAVALALGRPLPPAFSHARSADVQLVLAIRASDCLSCTIPTPALRRIERTTKGRVALTVLAVGAPSRVLSDFIENERLAVARTIVVDGSTALIDTTSLPSIYVVARDTVVGHWTIHRQEGVDRTANAEGIEALVHHVLEERRGGAAIRYRTRRSTPSA